MISESCATRQPRSTPLPAVLCLSAANVSAGSDDCDTQEIGGLPWSIECGRGRRRQSRLGYDRVAPKLTRSSRSAHHCNKVCNVRGKGLVPSMFVDVVRTVVGDGTWKGYSEWKLARGEVGFKPSRSTRSGGDGGGVSSRRVALKSSRSTIIGDLIGAQYMCRPPKMAG
jgi:hypothetical protein